MPNRARFVVATVFASVLSLYLALVGLLLLLGELVARHGPYWADVAVAVVIVGCVALCGMWVMHLEHRLRGHPPGKIAFQPDSLARDAPARWQTPRRHRNSPIAMAIAVLYWTALTICSVVVAFHLHEQAELSGYVQASGLPRSATVISVANIQHRRKGSTWYTAHVTAYLITPRTGYAATTVYVPFGVSYHPGEHIPVLVDLRQPGYSELPGSPYTKPVQWIAATAVSVLGLGLDGLFIRAEIRTIRRRHAWRATLAGTYQPSHSRPSH
jgi:hypothetical protein